jgi:hypothetical protein
MRLPRMPTFAGSACIALLGLPQIPWKDTLATTNIWASTARPAMIDAG